MEIPKDNLFYGLRKKMTPEQEYFVNCILDNVITFCNAESGSGKTTMAVAAMKFLYDNQKIDKVYYIVSPVEEKTLGYRPGDTKEKVDDYLYPLRDALIKIGEQPEKAMHEEHGWIEGKPDTFLRGTNMERVGVILEEAQNYTRWQLKKSISRVHENSHAVIIGHDGQIDLPNQDLSGFRGCIDHFSQDSRVKICELNKNFRGWVSKLADSM